MLGLYVPLGEGSTDLAQLLESLDGIQFMNKDRRDMVTPEVRQSSGRKVGIISHIGE